MTAGELMVAQRVETREDLSFDEIFESYHERIYNCIYRLVGNPEEAHDLTQETFLRAYAGLPKIDGELKVGPWLYRIATNLCMDQLRRRTVVRRAGQFVVRHRDDEDAALRLPFRVSLFPSPSG